LGREASPRPRRGLSRSLETSPRKPHKRQTDCFPFPGQRGLSKPSRFWSSTRACTVQLLAAPSKIAHTKKIPSKTKMISLHVHETIRMCPSMEAFDMLYLSLKTYASSSRARKPMHLLTEIRLAPALKYAVQAQRSWPLWECGAVYPAMRNVFASNSASLVTSARPLPARHSSRSGVKRGITGDAHARCTLTQRTALEPGRSMWSCAPDPPVEARRSAPCDAGTCCESTIYSAALTRSVCVCEREWLCVPPLTRFPSCRQL